ncbi:hypothetical protein [Demequina lignilytica]|uniref:Tat pathway signal sequence domain protein n=1 Tax=Demequina lignilytica TaxID=3051663 RepID=A0AB35MKD8_9MICO|nr:hypothetical protein [Demequina sp. SYSU T0a273]MDN4484192.1 hypothetical protein [Demequina sp. SYSU T0a273]
MTENTVARPQAPSSISRRRVVQGVAWATPAILIATASPPAAASDGDGIPYMTAISSGYASNYGNSNQTITITMSYDGNGGTTPVVVKTITVDYIKYGGNSNQTGEGELKTANWVIQSDTKPLADNAPGTVVFAPSAAQYGTFGGAGSLPSPLQFGFNINRFSEITNVKVVYNDGTGDKTINFKPVKTN